MGRGLSMKMRRTAGFTLIEVLITFLIVTVGLLGLAALQAQTLRNQMESYQRLQAAMLVSNMATRIRLNPSAAIAGSYPAGTAYGTDARPADCATTRAIGDICEWHDLISGASVNGGGVAVGAPILARGCISTPDTSGDGTVITVSVAWQGLSPANTPGNTCGQGAFGEDEELRRVIYRQVWVRG